MDNDYIPQNNTYQPQYDCQPEYGEGFVPAEPPKKKKKTGLIIAIIAVVLALAVGACFYFGVFGQSPEEVAEEVTLGFVEDDCDIMNGHYVRSYEEALPVYWAKYIEWAVDNGYASELYEEYEGKIDTWDDYLEFRSELADEEFDSMDDYAEFYRDQMKDEIEDIYGDYTVSTEATDIDDISKKKVKKAIEEVYGERADVYLESLEECGFDIDDCDNFKCVTVEYTIEGEDDDYEGETKVYLVKVGMSWKYVLCDLQYDYLNA